MLARRSGDLASSEDAVQEALLVASTHWVRDGVPEHPRAWLVRTAWRRLLDLRRSEQARRAREQRVVAQEPPPGDVPDRDDSVALLFGCCHPALSPPSAIALTLRAVAGLTTAQVSRAFLVPEPTMAQRISRAKATIRASDEPFGLPGPELLAARSAQVLHVLYLLFNEGYATSSGPHLHRTDLSDEAIRLTRLVHDALPDDGEAGGLLALLLLVDARRAARTDPAGALVPLPDQDRSRWDRAKVTEGLVVLEAALARGTAGPYQLQAAIAALHDRAPRAQDTDWPQILALYGLLQRIADSPVVTLNRAVAASMVDGPAAGLAVLDEVGERLAGHPRLHAVRAHLLEQSGDDAAALAEYRAAASRTTNTTEQRHLLAHVARLTSRRG